MFSPDRLEELSWYPSISMPEKGLEIATVATADYRPDEIVSSWESSMATPGAHVLLDLDENLFDTVQTWITTTNRFLHSVAKIPEENLPDIQTVLNAGGPSKFYPNEYPDLFPKVTDPRTGTVIDSYDEYFADILRHLGRPNQVSPNIVEDLPSVVATINEQGTFLGALTARGSTTVVVENTQKQLKRAGLASVKIVFKREEVPLKKASQEKLQILERLAEAGGAEGYIVIIDDSISTANLIAGYNRTRGDKRPIIQIVYGGASLTKPRIERGEFSEDPDNGVFIMHDWKDLQSALERVDIWMQSQN